MSSRQLRSEDFQPGERVVGHYVIQFNNYQRQTKRSGLNFFLYHHYEQRDPASTRTSWARTFFVKLGSRRTSTKNARSYSVLPRTFCKRSNLNVAGTYRLVPNWVHQPLLIYGLYFKM